MCVMQHRQGQWPTFLRSSLHSHQPKAVMSSPTLPSHVGQVQGLP